MDPDGLIVTPTIGHTLMADPMDPDGMIVTPRVGVPVFGSQYNGTGPFVFPILSMPSSSYILRRQYQTNIITSRGGQEQRRALRGIPRKTVEYSTAIKGNRWLDFNRRMVRGQRMRVIIADETRLVKTSSISSGSDLPLESMPNWVQEGQRIVLVDFANERYEQQVIAGTDGDTAIMGSIPSSTYPSGTYVYGGLKGWLEPNMDHDINWFRFAVPKLQFKEEPGTGVLDPAMPIINYYNGREVFLFRPNLWIPVTITDASARETIDYGFGALEGFDIVGFTRRMWSAAYSMRDDNIDLLRGLFDRMKGQQGEFYMPTFQNDLPPKSQANSGTNTLTVEGRLVDQIFSDSTIYKAIAVILNEDPIPTVLYNRVTGIALSGNDSVLTVATNWTQNITVGTKISWMPVWRFATDIFETEYIRGPQLDVVINTKPSFLMLEDLTVSTAPIITSVASKNVASGATLSHALTASEAVTWSIVGGADAEEFELLGSTLRWLSNGTRAIGSPQDANLDNEYLVIIRAASTTTTLTADQPISVRVV